MSNSKWYVVWVGKTPGIYTNWNDCKAQVDGVPGAKYKSYPTRAEAEKAYEQGFKKAFAAAGAGGGAAAKKGPKAPAGDYDRNSICVDAASSGNPGVVEYQGVDTATGERLFHQGPIPKGTNNLGEFLAIVHGLAYLKQRGSDKAIYSDSQTAIKWVRDKRVATTLARDASTEDMWRRVDRAMAWLAANSYSNKIMKWDTEAWGEVKADFGRK
ncbi:ribonuclease H [Paenibacillus sp.]|uniref:ribonuclease H n=1 Tax=Paenibacillus sp. TaxID=58172 RepID=UPI002D52E364|nr:ribonuclease H family protein [Paenibacillus sp.]HZG86923.1 ribonuclease H family protein [Paenibacillus sp.]